MSINFFKTIFFFLLLIPELFYAQSIQFSITGKNNRPVKGADVYFTDVSCSQDSLAKLSGQHYQFNCFPEGIVPVHIEAKGYELKTVMLDKRYANSVVSVNLLKKSWQTIRLEDATYKFWKLKNVLYIKEKDEASSYRLGVLLDSLGLFESPYYGNEFYEHENGQDFSAFDSPILEFLRNHELTLIVSPVILLFRELKDGEKKFQTINKILPITNIIEFEDNQIPPEAVLRQFCLEKYWIYDNQVGNNSPFAFKTINQKTGLCILDIIEIIQKSNPELEPKIFNPANWYSLEFDQSISPEEDETDKKVEE